ncbi:MAG: hypothetical protein Q8876_09830 [Bacillota bacterium]|nr:hypothetical protein [Bacillota bacterium]
MRKICSAIIIILALFLCSCSANLKGDSNVSANTSQAQKAQVASTADTKSNISESASVKSGSSVDNTTGWPGEFDGKLPKPDCTITGVIRYDENSMSGKLTLVNFSDMSKENAEKYVKELKDMGFANGLDMDNDTKIVFSGVGNDASAKNGVNFMYDVSTKSGSISY